MPNVIDLRRRIKSVKNTQQLTKAMKTVSAAKLKRAQNQLFQARPYTDRLKAALSTIVALNPDITHPFLEKREESQIDLVIVTADKGLCGPFNAQTIRYTLQLLSEMGKEKKVNLIVLGKKGYDFFKHMDYEIKYKMINFFFRLHYSHAAEIAENLKKDYIDKKTDAVYFVYNKFISISKSELVLEKLIPIAPEEIKGDFTAEYEFEPTAEEIFSELLPFYVNQRIYRILLESAASEHSARMLAMDLATKNAEDMIKSLTLTMNKIRQAAITKEILEIVTAAEAMKKSEA